MHYQFPPSTGRRRFLQALVALGLLGVVGCRPTPKPLKISAQVWPGFEFLFLARQREWLDPEQISLIEVIDASDSARLLADGLVDGAALTLDEVLRLRAKGVDLTVIAIFDFSAGADAVVARPSVRSLADLKGKRIGVEDTAVGGLMLLKMLQHAKISLDEVTVRHATAVEHEALWQRGEVDALVTYDPVLRMIEGAGAKRIFDSNYIPGTIVDVLAVRPQVLKERAPALRNLLEGHFRALNEFNRVPKLSASDMSARLHVKAGDIPRLFSGLVMADLAYNQKLLASDNPVLIQTATQIEAFMLQSKWIDRPSSVAGLFDDSLLSTLAVPVK